MFCPSCNQPIAKKTGEINRAKKYGRPLYCNRACAGIGRRTFADAEAKKDAKAKYDKDRRARLADRIRAEKAEFHRRTYDPQKAAIIRKARAPKHAEYCRRPEYREWKREYDRGHRAKTEYGEYWESAILALDIRRACLDLMDDHQIRQQAGTLNKQLKRRREYDRAFGSKSEIGALGNIE
jgi:hypothetical protein